MALIKCPDCSKEISDQAPACPNCGRPKNAFPVPDQVLQRAFDYNKSGGSKSRIWIKCPACGYEGPRKRLSLGQAWLLSLAFLALLVFSIYAMVSINAFFGLFLLVIVVMVFKLISDRFDKNRCPMCDNKKTRVIYEK
ncbi:MAG: hypothetical protein M1269_06495 [Chloroflexi bacterium]|nr:hypothetical protein [Chloroflexota bacterium]